MVHSWLGIRENNKSPIRGSWCDCLIFPAVYCNGEDFAAYLLNDRQKRMKAPPSACPQPLLLKQILSNSDRCGEVYFSK